MTLVTLVLVGWAFKANPDPQARHEGPITALMHPCGADDDRFPFSPSQHLQWARVDAGPVSGHDGTWAIGREVLGAVG